MLNATDKLAAKLADNLCFLGDFATGLDYALDEAGCVAFEYNVPLAIVATLIADHDAAMKDYYLSLGYEPNPS